MGLQWRKRVRLGGGSNLNLSLKSLGLSFGGRGARLGFNTRRGTRASVGIPGTGLSYSTKLFGGSRRRSSKRSGVKDTLVGAGFIWILIAVFTPVTAATAFWWWLGTCVFMLIFGRK